MTLLRQDGYAGQGPRENRTTLLVAAHHFLADPKRYRDKLAEAVLLEVERPLYEQLRTAARRWLRAEPDQMPAIREAASDLFRAISDEVDQRRAADRRRDEAAQRLAMQPPLPPAERRTLDGRPTEGRRVRSPDTGELFTVGGEDAA